MRAFTSVFGENMKRVNFRANTGRHISNQVHRWVSATLLKFKGGKS